MAVIIIFAISLIGLMLLFSSKLVVEKTGNMNLWSSAVSRLDPKAARLNAAVTFKWKQITQTIKYVLFILIPHRTEESWKEAKKAAVGHYKKQKDILMGKKNFSNSVSASFYLKKIKEDRLNGKDGIIVDHSLSE